MLSIFPHTSPDIPTRRFGYFKSRKARRMISRTEAPATNNVKPIEPKSIDFSSFMDYTFCKGKPPCGGLALLTSLNAQSGSRQILQWLQGRPGQQVTGAGFLKNSSWQSPPFGFLGRVDIINIPQVVYNVKLFSAKKENIFRFSGLMPAEAAA
jgi:hypothetical protein